MQAVVSNFFVSDSKIVIKNSADFADGSVMGAYIHLDRNWGQDDRGVPEHTHSFGKNVYTRVAYAALAPLALYSVFQEAVIGTASALAAIATLGLIHKVNASAIAHLSYSFRYLQLAHLSILRFFDPSIPLQGGSYFAIPTPSAAIEASALKQSRSDNFFVRHVTSRLTYALLAVSMIVTRVVEAVLVIPAVVLSIFFFGEVKSVNNFALNALSAPKILLDVFFCAINMINPGVVILRNAFVPRFIEGGNPPRIHIFQPQGPTRG